MLSHFNSTAQYSNYFAIVNPNTPGAHPRHQSVCPTDPVICSGSRPPTAAPRKQGGVICRISLFKERPVISVLGLLQLQNVK